MYFFDNAEIGETTDISGEDLIRDGFTFALPARSGAIWFYRGKSEQEDAADHMGTSGNLATTLDAREKLK